MIPTNPLGRGLLRIRFLVSPLADGSIWLMGRKAGVTLKWVFGHCYGGRDNSKKPVCCDSIADTNVLLQTEKPGRRLRLRTDAS